MIVIGTASLRKKELNTHFLFSVLSVILLSLLMSITLSRFACMEPASLTIVPDIILPTVDGRQLSPENCVSSNKEVQFTLTLI